MSAPTSATGGGAVRTLLGRLFRRTSLGETSISPAPSLPTRMVRARVPSLPPTRWTTVQVSIEESDQGRQITDVLGRRYAVSKPTLLRFLRDGQIILLRAPKLPLPPGSTTVPVADPTTVHTIHPRENMRVEAGDLVYLTQVRLAPRPPPSLPTNLCDIGRRQLGRIGEGRKIEQILSSEEIAAIRSLVLYQDERIIVLNKPSGLAVHGGPRQEQHLGNWLEALREPKDAHAPLLVHRLDRDTSGALILARTRQAAADLARRFRLLAQRVSNERGGEEKSVNKDATDGKTTDGISRLRTRSKASAIEKVYWALVHGCPDRRHRRGRIVSAMYTRLRQGNAKQGDGKGECMTSLAHKRADLLDQGKTAITDYRWMQTHRTTRKQLRQWKRDRIQSRTQAKESARPSPPALVSPSACLPPPSHQPHKHVLKLSLIELRPRTGRTHQLRVHMAEQLRMPILGDYKYFPRQHPGHRMHLHCHQVVLDNWLGPGKTLSVKAPLPEHWVQTMYAAPLHLRAPPKLSK